MIFLWSLLSIWEKIKYFWPESDNLIKNSLLKIIFLIIAEVVLSFCIKPSAYAGEEWKVLTVVPEQITVCYTNTRHLNFMEKKLKVSFLDKKLLRSFGYGRIKTNEENQNYKLKIKIVSVMQRVQMILDMHLDTIKLDFFIFKTRQDFNRYYLAKFGFPSPSHSVYKQKEKAIYLTLSELDTGILAHEMGHYVICAYSLIPPPVNTQEILCQYLDKYIQAKKYSGLLLSE